MEISAGCDLGLKNFGFAIVKGIKRPKVLYAGMIRHTVTDLKQNVLKQRRAFIREIKPLLHRYKVKKLIVERFLTRGRFGGAIGECLSFMLGILAGLCQQMKIEFITVTAAAWKNAFQRRMQKKLESLYKFLKPLPPHLVDATLQATYSNNPQYNNWSVKYLKILRDGYNHG